MAGELYAEIEWTITLDDQGGARHSIKAHLKNVSARLRGAVESISISPFDELASYGEPHSEIDGRGITRGFRPSAGAFILPLPQTGAEPKQWENSIRQNAAVSKIGNLALAMVSTSLDFTAPTVRFTIILPKIGGWRGMWATMVAFLCRKEGKYETLPVSCLPDRIEDYGSKTGTFIYVTDASHQKKPSFGVAFRTLGNVDIFAFLGGAIVTIVLGLIATAIWSVFVGT